MSPRQKAVNSLGRTQLKSIYALLYIAAIVSGCASSASQPSSPLFSILEGRWDDDDPTTCQSHRTISFAKGNSKMIMSYSPIGYATENDSRKDFVYVIYEVTDTMIRAELEEEQRLDSNGKPVVWQLKLIDESTYCWGRDDWPSDACTPPRWKCKS